MKANIVIAELIMLLVIIDGDEDTNELVELMEVAKVVNIDLGVLDHRLTRLELDLNNKEVIYKKIEKLASMIELEDREKVSLMIKKVVESDNIIVNEERKAVKIIESVWDLKIIE